MKNSRTFKLFDATDHELHQYVSERTSESAAIANQETYAQSELKRLEGIHIRLNGVAGEEVQGMVF